MQLKPRSQVGQTKTVNGAQYRLNQHHRWEKLTHEAAHQADHLGESVVSWKVGKVLGGAIHAVAAQHGIDSEHAAIAAETIVQAATATALHAIKQQRSGKLDPRETAAYFVAQAAAAYGGKYAHHGADLAVQSFHVEGMMHTLAPLLAGKTTGIGTVTVANKTGLNQRIVDAVVAKGRHDLNLLTNFLTGLNKSADLNPALSALLWDLFQAAVTLAHSQPMHKALYSLGGATYSLVGDRLIKSNEPIKRVMRWKKIPIGVTHDMGDKRHGRVLPAGYGHIRGSYGDAEDGMSVDIYLGSDLGSDQIFRIKQIVPDTGEFDEWKYMIGCWSKPEARDLFQRCMPKRFYGGIESVSLKSLEKYQV